MLRTDHASLRWLRSFKYPEGQVARWLEILESYQFKLIHRPGKLHSNADALSRSARSARRHEGEGRRRNYQSRTSQASPREVRLTLHRS